MRKYFIVAFAFLIVSINFYYIPERIFAHSGVAHEIKMDETGFSPKTFEIEVGEPVIFKNVGKKGHWPASNIHPTHGIYPEFDPKREIAPGDTWTFVFKKTGVFRMHDHVFPEFTGVITVKADQEEGTGVKNNSSFFQQIVNFVTHLFQKKEAAVPHKYNQQIQKDDTTISDDKDALYSYVKKFGPKKAVLQLASVDYAQGRECHEDAHALGKYAYELYGDKTFGMCSAECHSGCYHGATEAFFKKHGTDNLSDNLKVVCGTALNPFFNHQCLHGIGHGLMAWSDYEIYEALKDCDLLESGKESCYSGVFMENIVGALAPGDKSDTQTLEPHYTKYLSDDPHYPCTVVKEKYKGACYFYQTSRMVQLFHFDFVKVSKACQEVELIYRSQCFESMGRDVGGFSYNVPEKAIGLCSVVPPGVSRIDCLEGAVQNAFWDSSGQDVALKFCKLLEDNDEKAACYAVITERATQVLADKENRDQFCQKAESMYVTYCFQQIDPKF